MRPRHTLSGAALAVLLAATLTPAAGSASAAEPPAAAASAARASAPIQAVAAIEARLGAMKTRERALEDFSVEGSRATVYSAAGSLRKIDVTALGERGRSQLEFWWQGRALIAARERVWDYGDSIMALPVDKPLPMKLVGDDWVDYGKGGPRLWSMGNAQPVIGAPARERANELAATARKVRQAVNAR